MAVSKYDFLQTVLGTDGANALCKASERQEVFDGAILPRTILAWLSVADTFEYDDALPGTDDSHLKLKKSDGVFNGSISIDGDIFTFDASSTAKVAAHIAVALGVNPFDRVAVKADDKLGKSLDLLAKTQLVKSLADVKPGAFVRRDLQVITPARKAAGTTVTSVTQGNKEVFDYSHLLPEPFQRTHQLILLHKPENAGSNIDNPYTMIQTHLIDKSTGKVLDGGGKGYVNRKKNEIETHLEAIPVNLRGRGIGKALHLALIAHAFQKLGVRTHLGGPLTNEGMRTVASVARDHGIDFKPTPAEAPATGWGGNDRILKSGDLEKNAQSGAGKPGPQHMIEQGKPNAPKAPIQTQPRQQRKPEPPPPSPKVNPVPPLPPIKSKIPTGRGIRVKLSLSESANKCGLCGAAQFSGGKFTGCMCFRDLAKHSDMAKTSDGYLLNLHTQYWDEDAVATLNAALRGN